MRRSVPNTLARTSDDRHGRRAFRACLLALASVGHAFGAGKTEPIRIEYRAQPGAGCPTGPEFEAQVFARTRSARPASEAEPARTFIIDLRRRGAEFAGSLVIQEKDGASMARRVNGSECADVATVLALATALAIDPRAELAPRQELDESADAASPLESPEPVAPELTPDEASDIATAGTPSAWSPRWALGAALAFGAAPEPAFGVSLVFSLERRPQLMGEVGLELAYRRAGTEAIRDATASFHYYVARPTLCPASLGVGSRFFASPCAVLELGGVTGVGSEIPDSEPESRFWAAGELLLRLDLALGGAWFTTLDGGAQLPLTRYEFVFENPQTSIHEVPAVTATCALRVGTSF